MLYINKENYDIYQSKDDFITLLKKIENSEEDIEDINQLIYPYLSSDIQSYLSKLEDFIQLISLRKILDIGLSRHEYHFEKIEEMFEFINNYINKFLTLNSLPDPMSLTAFDNKQKYSPQNSTHPFETKELYRAVSILEYINIFTRRELPCSGNYFSPQCPYVIDKECYEDILHLPNYDILLKFILDENLSNILKEKTVIKEKGSFQDMQGMNLIPLDKKRKQEIVYGIKHEKNVFSFRMGNGLQYGCCYSWDFQQHLISIEIEKVDIENPKALQIYMDGAKKSNLHLRYNEIENYLKLLNNRYTFE